MCFTSSVPQSRSSTEIISDILYSISHSIVLADFLLANLLTIVQGYTEYVLGTKIHMPDMYCTNVPRTVALAFCKRSPRILVVLRNVPTSTKNFTEQNTVLDMSEWDL